MSDTAAIAEFCRSVGIPVTDLPLALELERSGRLHVERTGDAVTISLVRPMPLHKNGAAAAAMSAVHPDRGLPLLVRTAFLGEDQLVLLARISQPDLDLPLINTTISLLTSLADQVESTVT